MYIGTYMSRCLQANFEVMRFLPNMNKHELYNKYVYM